MINLEECVAISQNYVDEHNVGSVLSFLREKKDQIAGYRLCNDMYSLFKRGLQNQRPVLWEQLKDQVLRDEAPKKPSLWETRNTFSFGFNAEE